MPDSDDDDSDSDEEKRQNPYELIGLPDKERTPVKDIATTQRVLNRIHQKTMDTAVSEAERSRAEKRLIEIKWAADILLDEMNRRAFDEAGAIYPHEQQAWGMKSKWSIRNDQDRD
jgi:preprotein translocase subunit Sec63